MKIYYERSGGFTGIPVKVTLDTNSLPPDIARELSQALDAAKFFELPEKLSSPVGGADQFNHRLVIEDEGRRHAVEMADSAVPETLQPVLRKLISLARQQKTG